MDQQPQQQAEQPQPPVPELPVVPVVSESQPQLEQPQQPELPSESTEVTPQSAPLVSEPMGRPRAVQGVLEWQASEYVEHEKSAKWFIILAVVVVVFVALAVFLLKNYTFAVLIVVMAISVALWARRPAMEVQYKLESNGVWVGSKFFAIHDFRGFGVLKEGAIYAVVLLPIKRFSPGVTVYFPEELGEQIVDVLGTSLPMEEITPDWIDSITHKLNF
jgi:hypothetical protein